MQGKILLTCLLVFTISLLQAQVRLGVKGGLNLNKPFSGKSDKTPPSGIPAFGQPAGSFDLKTSWNAGLTADIQVTEQFHIRPDLLFIRRIAALDKKEEANNLYYKYTETLKADYLELPVQFVFFRKAKGFHWYAGGGPYLGLGISGKAKMDYFLKFEDGLNTRIETGSTSEDDWNQKFQVGAAIAAGIQLPFGLMGELSVRRGFNDASRSRMVDNINRIYQFSYDFSVGYLLNSKKKR